MEPAPHPDGLKGVLHPEDRGCLVGPCLPGLLPLPNSALWAVPSTALREMTSRSSPAAERATVLLAMAHPAGPLTPNETLGLPTQDPSQVKVKGVSKDLDP